MKLFDIGNRFKPPLNFNHNNFNNISNKFQRQDKNVTITTKDQPSHKSSWIQEKMMVVVCQPTRNPAPLDPVHLMVSHKAPLRKYDNKNIRRGLIQENLMVLVCNPTFCPPPLDLGYCTKTPTVVKRDEACDLLGLGSFGDVDAVQPTSTSFDEEHVFRCLDRLKEARNLRQSILLDPGLFSPSYSLRHVVLSPDPSTLSIGRSPKAKSISVAPTNPFPVTPTNLLPVTPSNLTPITAPNLLPVTPSNLTPITPPNLLPVTPSNLNPVTPPNLLPITSTQETLGVSNPMIFINSQHGLPAWDRTLSSAVESLARRPTTRDLQRTSSTGLPAFETRIPITAQCMPFVPRSFSVKSQRVPSVENRISPALSRVLPVSAPVTEHVTSLFAVQGSIHTSLTPVPASPASLVTAAADLLAMAPALTFSSGSSLAEICFTGGQATSMKMHFSYTSCPTPAQMAATPNSTSPILPPNRAYLMTVSMESVTSAREQRLNINVIETIESPERQLQNSLSLSVAMAIAPAPANAQSREIEAELVALMESDEEPVSARRIPQNTRRPLYMMAPPPQGQYMDAQPLQETIINPYDGEVYLFGDSHYNYRVIGQRIETIDAKLDLLPSLHFLYQNNPVTGTLNVIGSGMFGSVFTATYLPSGQTVAIKFQYQALEDRHKIISEARIMQLLSDTGYVPKLFGLLPDQTDHRKLHIVMEMIGMGITLRQKLEANTLDERQKIFLALRLAAGLHTIHEKGVLLNDIKDDNIIVFSVDGLDIQAKFIDFGHASCGFEKKYGGNGLTNARCTHLAPEVREGNPTTRASDVFGLGFVIALFQLTNLTEVVDQCMCPDPGQRPSAAIVSQMIMSLL